MTDPIRPLDAKYRNVLVNAIIAGINRPLGAIDEPGPSWRAIVRLFSNLTFTDTDDVWIGAEATFGWMPGMLYAVHEIEYLRQLILDVRARAGQDTDGKEFDPYLAQEVLNIVASLKEFEKVLTSLEISRGRGERNWSVVGTSKFLHFLAPHVVPIYDSRVGSTIRDITGDKKVHDTLKRPLGYLHYVSAVHEVARRIGDGKVQIPSGIVSTLAMSNLGKDVPIIRQIEYTLYHRSPSY